MLQACSSEDSSNSNDDSNPSDGLLLKTIGYTNGFSFNFYYDGNKLSKLTTEKASDNYATFTYTGNLISQINYYNNNNSLGIVHNFYYSNDEIVRSTYAESEGLYIQRDYVYSSGGKVVVTTKSKSPGGTFENSTETYYYSNGNILNIESNGEIESYTYDNKNSPWSNITGFLKIKDQITFGDNILNNTNNILTILNPTRSDSKTPINFIYKYNSQGYPTTSTQTQVGETSDSINYSYY
jgi:hypothetical protein